VHPLVPPVAAALAAIAAVLETAGLAVRLFGSGGRLADLLAMDGAGSVARGFVTGVLVAAAVGSVLVAPARPAARAWWGTAAVTCAVLAVAKAGGLLHARALPVAVPLLAAGLLVVWRFCRKGRQDCGRVLALLAAHAAVAVGLSAVSLYARATGGAVSAAFAVFVESSAEALTAVAAVVAVLAAVLRTEPGYMPGRTTPQRQA